MMRALLCILALVATGTAPKKGNKPNSKRSSPVPAADSVRTRSMGKAQDNETLRNTNPPRATKRGVEGKVVKKGGRQAAARQAPTKTVDMHYANRYKSEVVNGIVRQARWQKMLAKNTPEENARMWVREQQELWNATKQRRELLRERDAENDRHQEQLRQIDEIVQAGRQNRIQISLKRLTDATGLSDVQSAMPAACGAAVEVCKLIASSPTTKTLVSQTAMGIDQNCSLFVQVLCDACLNKGYPTQTCEIQCNAADFLRRWACDLEEEEEGDMEEEGSSEEPSLVARVTDVGKRVAGFASDTFGAFRNAWGAADESYGEMEYE